MQFATKLIHNGSTIDPTTGAASPPIYHASTFHQVPGIAQPFSYSRVKNPTRSLLEDTLACLESGSRAFAFGSGMAAIAAVFGLLKTGQHLLVSRQLYGGTRQILEHLIDRVGLQVTYVDMADPDQVACQIQSNTKALYIETPANPTLAITDIRALTALAKNHQLWTIADNTFMTPYLQQPLDLGVDIVIHSATKFLAGHSDVLAGAVIVNAPAIAAQLEEMQVLMGGILGPEDCWLTLRGLKTLAIRLDQSQANAQKLAQFLIEHPAVKRVHYPGLRSHPGYHLHRNQATGPGAVLSFELRNPQSLPQFVSRLHYAIYAVSLGGVETIVSHPATMSHQALSPRERDALGVTDALLRVSVGIESSEDLIEDFGQALDCSAFP